MTARWHEVKALPLLCQRPEWMWIEQTQMLLFPALQLFINHFSNLSCCIMDACTRSTVLTSWWFSGWQEDLLVTALSCCLHFCSYRKSLLFTFPLFANLFCLVGVASLAALLSCIESKGSAIFDPIFFPCEGRVFLSLS